MTSALKKLIIRLNTLELNPGAQTGQINTKTGLHKNIINN